MLKYLMKPVHCRWCFSIRTAPISNEPLPEGETRFISGKIEWYGGTPQIVHPDHILTGRAVCRNAVA